MGGVPRPRILVMASGSGTLLQAILDARGTELAHLDLVAVGSDRADCGALDRAAVAGVESFTAAPADFPDRAAWDRGLTEAVGRFHPDWVVCAGFMRLLGPAMLSAHQGKIVNSHPALLPSFPGAHGVRDALAYGVKVTGCTIHLVDSGVDTGPIIEQHAVDVRTDDTEDSLHERIKIIERRALVDVVGRLARHGCTITDRKVTIP